MPESSTRFVQIASFVTNRVAELLSAPVFVTNNRGIVITSREPTSIRTALGWEGCKTVAANFLRLPLCHEAETGEIIVGEPLNQETISRRLAQALVELVINQP